MDFLCVQFHSTIKQLIYTLIKGSIFNIEPLIFASYSFVLDYASIGLAYFFLYECGVSVVAILKILQK